jgi:hypothetical protein
VPWARRSRHTLSLGWYQLRAAERVAGGRRLIRRPAIVSRLAYGNYGQPRLVSWCPRVAPLTEVVDFLKPIDRCPDPFHSSLEL